MTDYRRDVASEQPHAGFRIVEILRVEQVRVLGGCTIEIAAIHVTPEKEQQVLSIASRMGVLAVLPC